ncbi:uncharacterized protein LOC118265720 [Spodoptera frugiperda]|uniref:Uncharacterized protein LOC118265720 n=1 Tax=Spodoptera frugiperda TaxID=7108 RepID=A0A9R0CZ86_SPOFR|nr:uncharacterized protein LOC118265720 [Spodoptera frugiperda]
MTIQLSLYEINKVTVPPTGTPNRERIPVLTLRLVSITLLVAVLTMHIRSVRVFRWEQSVSGGVLVTYCLAMTGLALCAGADCCDGKALQAYLCSTGAAMLLVNAGAIWHRWRRSGELTHVVAELLFALGVSLRRQIMIKVILSAAAAICLMLDLALLPIISFINTGPEKYVLSLCISLLRPLSQSV